MCVSWPQQGSGWEEPISVAEAMHISFADLPAPSARWPATCAHMVSGKNNSEKMKNASHSLQTNGYSAIAGKLSQSRQLSRLKKKGVKRERGGLGDPWQETRGNSYFKEGSKYLGKEQVSKSSLCFQLWKSRTLPVPSTGAHTCSARSATTAAVTTPRPVRTLVSHCQVIPKTISSDVLKPRDSAGLGTFWEINRLSCISRFLLCRGFVCQGLWYQHARPLEGKTHGETLEGTPKALVNRDVTDESTRAMTVTADRPQRHLATQHLKKPTWLCLHPCFYLVLLLSLFWYKLATIQKKVEQLGEEMYGIYTTAKCEKASACSIGAEINHFYKKYDRAFDLYLDCIWCEC